MKHHCHASECMEPVKPELLMCPAHWFTVPLKIRNEVLKYYRPGQCDDLNPSKEWHTAANAAIGYIARWEGRTCSKAQVAALRFYGYGRPVDPGNIVP